MLERSEDEAILPTTARIDSRLAHIGGLVQVLVALGLLVLPVFITCVYFNGDPSCYRQSYLEQDGSPVGYTILALGVLAGSVAILSRRERDALKAALSRWLAAAIGIIIVAIGIWSIGIVFLPGTLTILTSAFLTKPGRSARTTGQADDV